MTGVEVKCGRMFGEGNLPREMAKPGEIDARDSVDQVSHAARRLLSSQTVVHEF